MKYLWVVILLLLSTIEIPGNSDCHVDRYRWHMQNYRLDFSDDGRRVSLVNAAEIHTPEQATAFSAYVLRALTPETAESIMPTQQIPEAENQVHAPGSPSVRETPSLNTPGPTLQTLPHTRRLQIRIPLGYRKKSNDFLERLSLISDAVNAPCPDF